MARTPENTRPTSSLYTGIKIAVRAADNPLAGFSGNRLVREKRAQTPNSASQKDMAIQANKIANRERMTISRRVKPSNCSTPAICVTAATVEASTRKRYSQRRGAISGTAAIQCRSKLRRDRDQGGEKRHKDAPRSPGDQGLSDHRPGTTHRRSGNDCLYRCLKNARLGIHL